MVLLASRGIGNAGTMEIHDNGAQVQMRFRSADGQTFSGAIPYRIFVWGAWSPWYTTPYSKGSPWVTVWYETVGYSQSVAFQIGDTGTWGLGAGGDLWAAVSRATVPGAPVSVSVDQATPTSLRYIFSGTSTGGSPITGWQAQIATDAGFTQNVQTIGSSGTSTFTGLTPDKVYYFRSRGSNAVGWSAWSNVISGATLPAVAPGMTVMPSLPGDSVSIVLTPPGGNTTVTSYRVETRPVGGTTTVHNTSTSPLILPRTPGSEHEYRASAFIGSYQTPWTDWVTITQPSPNTTPGDYFDGATPAREDLTFAWLGTANGSASEARGVGAEGWAVATTNGAVARLQRITGGRSGLFSARAVILADATGTGGIHLGMDYADGGAQVASGGGYSGSIHVRPSRSQRIAAQLLWFNASNVEINPRITGEHAIVTDTSGWTRLVASGVAPAGAVRAIVRAVDLAGDGWSAWKSGEWLDADDAMVSLGLYPYFDGNTPSTSEFTYSWTDAENASTSMRQAITQNAPDPFADPDCPPIPSAPRPPAIDASCIDEVGSWRRYWAIIPESEVFDWLDVVPTLTLTTGEVATRQARVRFYSNPDELDPVDAQSLPWESELTVSYIPPNAEFILDGVSQRAWGSVNGAENISTAHLLYGTDNGPATWPTLSCGSSYLISFDVPLDAPEGNLAVSVALTTRMM